jgi:hypothetical protein
VLAASLNPPTRDEVKKLAMNDIAIMSGLADSLRSILKKYIQIDPYTMSDPFGSGDEYNYSVILDRQEPRRVVAMIASKLDPLPQLPWDDILGDRLVRLSLSKPDANALKNEMMPKDTNNFYQYRRSGKITGFIMFAFQVCGQH